MDCAFSRFKRKMILKYFIVFLSIFSVAYCAIPPLEKVNQSLIFEDDLEFENLNLALDRQIINFKKKNLNEVIIFGDRKIKREVLLKSALKLKELIHSYSFCVSKNYKNCQNTFQVEIENYFDIYKPIPEKNERGYSSAQTFFTAYYSPDFHGSFTKSHIYKNPIYAYPSDSKLQRLSSDEINYQGKLQGKKLELIFVKESLYDIWLLHVEGGGRVQVQTDKGIKYYYLSYASSNKQKFQMLYHYMLAQGMLVRGKQSIADQRSYFNLNPADQRAILNSCPSFIFFKLTDIAPLGVENIPLTDNRSLATDYRKFNEYGIINFVRFKRPMRVNGELIQRPFSRFFINQDTGGAIKGNARCDLFFGHGKDAELAANYTLGLGDQYLLILK